MKRLLCSILVFVLIVIGLTACGKSASAPEGYKIYDNGDISFAYPEDWVTNDSSVVILVNPDGIGNNITVAYEAQSATYANMDVSDFNTIMKPAFEASGLKVANAAVQQMKNKNGLDITEINFKVSYSGVDMNQTMYITNAGGKTYIVTITETTPDSELVKTVLDTLSK